MVVPVTADKAGLVGCRTCGLLSRQLSEEEHSHPACPRCGARLHRRKPQSLARTWALVIAAMVLYIPANVLPVTHTTYLGSTQSDTILSGVLYFVHSGSWHIALIIFVASLVVPALKLVVLSYLLVSVQRRSDRNLQERTRLYRITEVIGRWSMVDIYVVTVMVALLNLGRLADIDAGLGAVFFGAVVVITMFAANSFDPRLIWDMTEKRS
jgi:paraquat-inducible protein A